MIARPAKISRAIDPEILDVAPGFNALMSNTAAVGTVNFCWSMTRSTVSQRLKFIRCPVIRKPVTCPHGLQSMDRTSSGVTMVTPPPVSNRKTCGLFATLTCSVVPQSGVADVLKIAAGLAKFMPDGTVACPDALSSSHADPTAKSSVNCLRFTLQPDQDDVRPGPAGVQAGPCDWIKKRSAVR